MLRAPALLLGAALTFFSCTSTESPRHSEERPLLSVYFTRDGYLVPQIRALPEGDPVKEIFEILATEPSGAFLRTTVPPDASVLQEAEPQEGELVLDLSDSFWDAGDSELRTRVAQVVFTMAELEEGRAITLLDGSIPGRIPGVDGTPLPQPLSADDFPAPRPLVQIAQPPPGATVPAKIPVKVVVPKDARAYGIVSVDEHLGSKTRLRNGAGVLDTDIEGTREIKIVFVVLRDDQRASVSVPVTVSS